MKFFLTQKNLFILFVFFASLYLILAIIGGINHYSPVPYFDMWDSYINFYLMAIHGDLNAWWTQHNEHRIVLSKILFWFDLAVLKGQGIFLIIINYLLAGLGFFIIYKILQERLPQTHDRFTKHLIGLTIFCMSFSWLQSGNFIWAFQSQFFMAQILPLAAFFLLYKSFVVPTHAIRFFIGACLLGIAAIGTMGNGVLTLPLMVILAIMLRMHRWQIVILSLLAMLTLGFYFYDYISPAHHSSFHHTLTKDPIGLLAYMFLYLGGPFDVIFNRLTVLLAGIFLLICAIGFTWHAIKNKSSLELMLLTFILYVGGTALATGGSRFIFGAEQALAGRYTTPTLMAWSILLVLFAPMIAKQARIDWHRVLPLLLIPLLLLPAQFKTTHSTHGKLTNREVAVVALELGIYDETQMAFIYSPNATHLLSLAKIAAEHDFSVFGNSSIKDIKTLMGQKRPIISTPCEAYLDAPVNIDDPHYMRVSGWLFNSKNKTFPAVVYILNSEHVVVGYALTGIEREDAKLAMGKKAEDSGFKGYIYAEQIGQPIFLQGAQDCAFKGTF